MAPRPWLWHTAGSLTHHYSGLSPFPSGPDGSLLAGTLPCGPVHLHPAFWGHLHHLTPDCYNSAGRGAEPTEGGRSRPLLALRPQLDETKGAH